MNESSLAKIIEDFRTLELALVSLGVQESPKFGHPERALRVERFEVSEGEIACRLELWRSVSVLAEHDNFRFSEAAVEVEMRRIKSLGDDAIYEEMAERYEEIKSI